MASNNNPNQQHPLQPPPVMKSGSGIGRSAPIRTIPSAAVGAGAGVGGPPGPPRTSSRSTGGPLAVPSLPGGLATPPLVKSKLAFTPGIRVGQSIGQPAAPAPAAVAPATAMGLPRAAYTTTNPETATGPPPPPPPSFMPPPSQQRPPLPLPSKQPSIPIGATTNSFLIRWRVAAVVCRKWGSNRGFME